MSEFVTTVNKIMKLDPCYSMSKIEKIRRAICGKREKITISDINEACERGHISSDDFRWVWTKLGKPRLPEGLTRVEGNLNLYNYDFPLPESLTNVEKNLNLYNYDFPLPESLTSVGGNLNLHNYAYPLPKSLTSVGGDLYLDNYACPLPESLRWGKP